MNFTKENEDYQKKVIGDFFVQFDMAISVIPFIIPKIIYKKRYNQLEEQNIETLLANLTAEPLRNIFDSLLADNYKELPKLIEANQKLSKVVDTISTFRNSFAHGSYRLGWKNFNSIPDLDKDYFSLRHSKATKKGYEKRSRIYKIQQVEKLIEHLRIIYNSYILISAILSDLSINVSIDKSIEILISTISEIEEIEFKPFEQQNNSR